MDPRAPILIVDDEPAVADMIAIALQDEGYAVLKASNGAQAIDLLDVAANSPTPVALVVLDLVLPGITGIGVLRHLTQLATPPAVLALSASTTALQTARELGVQAALRKPFELTTLLALVQSSVG